MDTAHILVVTLFIVVVGPWILKRKARRKRPKVKLIVRCPHCQSDVGLDRVRNYICPDCNISTAFFTTATGNEPRPDLGTYECAECGATNFEGVMTCATCGNFSEVAGMVSDTVSPT